MFYIYADGNAVYAPHLSTEGYGVLSPKLTLELNKAGSLDFVLPPGNAMYDRITKLKSIITVFQNGEELFRGRVLHDEKDFYKQKQTYCEGELAFLLDSQQRPIKNSTTKTVKAWFQYYISNHNSRVEAAKKFTAGNITVADANTSLTLKTEDYSSTWDEIEQRLLNEYGGYLKVRVVNGVRYLDWLAESGETSSQIIEFGRNLLDITEHITAENIFTVLIPLGKTQSNSSGATTGKLTIASVNSNKDYLEDATAINLFGRIEATMDWSEVDNASTLKSLGQTALKQNIEQSITLTVKAVDMHLLDVNTEAIRLGDWVQVVSLPHGLNKLFQCTKIVYDMVSPDQTEYTFGVAYSSLTDKQANAQKLTQNAVSVIQNVNVVANYGAATANKAAETADKAAADIQTIINNGTGGTGISLEAVYPVGAIYMSVSSGNPADIFGFGTWEQIKDRFLLAAGSSYTAGATGGEATHTLTVNEMPSHSHTLKTSSYDSTRYSMLNADSSGLNWVGENEFMLAAKRNVAGISGVDNIINTSNLQTGEPINNTGGSQAHNNMPPYLAVYVWKRVS